MYRVVLYGAGRRGETLRTTAWDTGICAQSTKEATRAGIREGAGCTPPIEVQRLVCSQELGGCNNANRGPYVNTDGSGTGYMHTRKPGR